MSNYRRVKIPGGVYFFTVVTYHRKPIFNNIHHIEILRAAFKKVRRQRPFDIDAIVILSDHLHCIWRLPDNDSDYSTRWREIKKLVSKQINPVSNIRNERMVWQKRFWEHAIRDETDWRTHMDYIHYNPVKHGLVERVKDWPWSSFARAVDRGWYDSDWGSVEPENIRNLDLE